MSIRVLNWVFEHSETRLGERLVLLALADYAHDDGREAYPSYEKLAQKAKVSRKQAMRCCLQMEKAGHLVRYGYTEYGTVKWRVVMDHDEIAQIAARKAHDEIPGFDEATKGGRDNMSPPDMAASSQNTPAGRDNLSPPAGEGQIQPTPGTKPAARGDKSGQTPSDLSPKPSVEPSVEPSNEPNPQPPSPKGAKAGRPGTPRSRGENPRAIAKHGQPRDLAAPRDLHQALLARLKDQLRESVEQHTYDIWLADLTVVGVDEEHGDALVLDTSADELRGWVHDRFPEVIATSAQKAGVAARLRAGNDRTPGGKQ